MKLCTKCHQEKPDNEYFVKDKKSGRLHAQCKQCYKIHRATYYKAHYQKYHEQYLKRATKQREAKRAEYRTNMLNYLKNQKCKVCGENDIRVLEFDHIDETTKLFSISQGISKGYSWELILQEINKCQILCANCHKKRTAEQFGWYKNLEARTGIAPVYELLQSSA